MDWQIGTAGRRSSFDGRAFSPGETFVSLICLGSRGEVERIDLRIGELEDFTLPGPVLGRWNRTVPEDTDAGADEKAPVTNAGDLFLAMMEEGEPADLSPEARTSREHLLHLLTLYLERRKVLRPVGSRRGGAEQVYRHLPTGVEYRVPVPRIDPAVLVTIGDALDSLIEGA